MIDADDPQEFPQIPGIHFVVALVDLERIELNATIHDAKSVDCFDINQLLIGLEPQRPVEQSAGLRLLASLTSYHFDPDHRTEPFKPLWIDGNRRSLVPADLHEEQINIIAELAPTIENPGLRARLADVSWFMQRRRNDMADVAINAYCDAVEAVRAGDGRFAHDDNSAWGVSAKEALVRGTSISHATRWLLPSSDRVKALISDLVRTARDEERSDDFWRIAEVDLDHGITAAAEIAVAAEELAGNLGDAPEARLRILELASRAHRRNRDEECSARCLIESAECHVQKADFAASPMLKATFLQEAIQALRNLPGTKDRRAELTARLRAVQPSIRDEMGHFSTEIDLTEVVEHSVGSVRGHSWPTAFLSLVLCDRLPTPDEIRSVALQYAREHPLQSIMPMQVHDFQGRMVFRSPGMAGNGETEGDHLRYLMAFHRGHSRHIAVAGAINPIRRIISEEHPVSSDIIVELLEGSPFIPGGHHHIYARAISHFLAGEDLEALTLLTPQLENSLRHILALNGHDTTMADDNGLQTEASLSILLNSSRPWRAQLEQTIPARYIHEIDLLFDFSGGPAVRNQVAHGKVPAGGFWDHDFIYASWLIIHLAILPMAQRWVDVEEIFARVTGLVRTTGPPECGDEGDPPD